MTIMKILKELFEQNKIALLPIDLNTTRNDFYRFVPPDIDYSPPSTETTHPDPEDYFVPENKNTLPSMPEILDQIKAKRQQKVLESLEQKSETTKGYYHILNELTEKLPFPRKIIRETLRDLIKQKKVKTIVLSRITNSKNNPRGRTIKCYRLDQP